MNRIAEFYESNNLLILLVFALLIGIYFLSTKNSKQNTKPQEIKTEEDKKIKKLSISESLSYNAVLPIELIPVDSKEFLKILLKTKSAKITTFYKNGTNESKVWNASKMDRKSNVIGNLRSRVEFRNGNWQKANIAKVVVEVVSNSFYAMPINKKNIKINPSKSNSNIIVSNFNKNNMFDNFRQYLIQQGYSEYTPSGNPSTVYDYVKRVEKILEREKISISKLTENIDFYVSKYDNFGTEAEFGKKSHSAFINALKRFQDFCQ